MVSEKIVRIGEHEVARTANRVVVLGIFD